MPEKKNVIPDDPFEAIRTDSPQTDTSEQDRETKGNHAPPLHGVEGGKSSRKKTQGVPDASPGVAVRKVGFTLPVDVLEEMESIVARLMAYPEYLTNSKAAEQSLRAWILDMRTKHNNGEPFPLLPPDAKPKRKGGRPRGS